MPGLAAQAKTRAIFVLFAAILALALTGCAGLRPAPEPATEQQALARVLDLAGKNAHEIRAFINRYEHDPQKREAAVFLAANLPLADAASMTADRLGEHLDYAFLARRLNPWAEDVPWDVFLHYVIPHRVSQEPALDYRREFFQQLAPRVTGLDMEQAAREVNAWVLEQAGYRVTQAWDQGPLTTTARGYGRCEEDAILYIAAARSVGIPARLCMTPFWQHDNDNHAWVEVFIDGTWHFLGAGELEPVLDTGWFKDPASLAPMVVSMVYGQTQNPDGPVYRRGHNFSIINSTFRYTEPYSLEVMVVGPDKKPVPGAEVYVSVYNYACIRPIARIRCDENGRGELTTGRATLMLTVAHGNATDFEMVGPGDKPVTRATLDLGRDRLPQGALFFAFHPPSASPRENENPGRQTVKAEAEAITAAREAEFAAIGQTVRAFAQGSPECPDDLAEVLEKAGKNAGEIMRALEIADEKTRPVLLRYISDMHAYDLVQAEATDLVNDADLAIKARETARALGLTYPDEVFYEYVLNNRVYYESFAHWRQALHERFAARPGPDVKTAAKRVNRLTASLAREQADFLAPIMDPGLILKSGRIAREEERAILAAAALRAAGIPARYLKDWGWVEYYDGNTWLPLYPGDPDSLARTDVSETTENYYSAWSGLEVVFTVRGTPVPAKDIRYFEDFSISRFTEQGYFQALEPEAFGEDGSFPPGKYYFTAGRRNEHGEPLVLIQAFVAEPGKPVQVQVDFPF